MSGVRLELEDLSHAYGKNAVLRGASLTVESGEIVGLLGPNGCGKSTLLKLLTGGLPLTNGSILWNGQSLTPASRAWRSNVGIVFQSPSLDGVLTARENLLLAGTLRGLNRRDAAERATSALSRVGLTDSAAAPVKTLSGGMRRRVDIARALLTEPLLLLLDEPSNGLDEASFRSLWEHLAEVNAERGTTIIVATHRPDEAERCDRVAVIDDGVIAEVDAPDALRRRIADDLIVVRTSAPEQLATMVRDALSLDATVQDGHVYIECEGAPLVVPRLFEAVDASTIETLEIRRPSLADVFLKITGRSLSADRAAETA
ncbi:MAG: ABC-2 type transport system ATP-binding protein [Flavobacteriales bacterium]|jgi:ABC-2 type transport system ATP-binding protein